MDEPVNLKEFSVSIKTEAELKEGASHIVSILRPQWKKECHKYKFFSDGITNKLIGVYVDPDKTDMVLIRVYGTKSELLIDRQAEIRNIKLMTETGLGGKLYATFSNGLAYQYVHGDVMTNDVVKNPEVYPVVAATVAKMHRVASKGHEKAEPCLWIKMRQFFELSPDEFPNDADQNARYKASDFSKAEREAEMMELQGLLENSGNPVVFCHNDLVLANIILQPGNKVSFIDFEYGDFNYQAFDIAGGLLFG
jgi:ethanolamine kinase